MKETKTSFTNSIPVKSVCAEHYVSPHGHQFDLGRKKTTFTFLFIVKGNVTFKTLRDSIDGKAGDFFYIPHGIRYTSYWFGDDGTEHYCIHAKPADNIKDIDSPYSLQKITELSNKSTLEEIKSIFYTSQNDNKSRTKIAFDFFALYSKLIPYLKKDTKPEISDTLAKAIKYIEQNCREPLSVPLLAKKLDTSESTIYHIFKKELGATPIKYYNTVRLESVIVDIDSGDTIENIAYRNGFESYGYFRELFKKYTGMTPKQYRKYKN